MGIEIPLVCMGALNELSITFDYVPLETRVVQKTHCNDAPPGSEYFYIIIQYT